MIIKPLIRRNFFIFASSALVFIMIAVFTTWIMTSFERDRMFTRPAKMNRTLLSSFDEDPFVALSRLKEFSQKTSGDQHDLIDAEGVSLVELKQVLEPLDSEQLQKLQSDQSVQLKKSIGPGQPPMIVSTTNKPGVFLLSRLGPPPGKPPVGPFVLLGSLILCVLISIGLALIYQFSKYRARAEEAFSVLSSLRDGKLSARMPERKYDELSPLITAFNQMAGDIEGVVDQLRRADHSRRELLQDLAHDLRTPLTSLKTFLDTLKYSSEKLTENKRQEILDLCSSEVEYFGKLVEDLLFLAQITEPKYSLGTEHLDLRERVADQMTVFRQRYPNIDFKIETAGDDFQITGSTKLMDRLLRNAFENSCSFARHKILVKIESHFKELRFSLIDDGPGFSEKTLAEFGTKKASRQLVSDSEHKRISVGIGSVIMKEIATLHLGHISAENILEHDKVIGAKVSFWFTKL
ncbi:sensor histidine kinase [Bdellovibrio reynosensis]|uniref:histidine kinase n=1 Tax=Bdellovibrio reynosensis TaxID=2835041 RepID=A0ABY4C5X8_9BACT|nr:HAMP domain-containing sensor histidine kinase [Bdellovibrio reynosensis]UOE99893.1 HAMP domain-containing histidine kinase [Bdellovibrio reynosensis]